MSNAPAPVRHYLQFTDLSADEYAHVFARAAEIKRKFGKDESLPWLIDRLLRHLLTRPAPFLGKT